MTLDSEETPIVEGDGALDQVTEKLRQARKELLDTTTRSRLLHTPVASPRAKIIRVEEALAEDVFGGLVREKRSMGFRPTLEALDVPIADPPFDDASEARGGPSATRLLTTLGASALQARLRGMAYDAQTILSEQGVNVLYVALGFLKWYAPPDLTVPRYAPLILVPVMLTRATARERYRIAYSDEEISTNLSLQERLKDEGVTLPDLSDFDDIQPSRYCEAVASAVAGMPEWTVEQDLIVVGFFSFAKLMMYRDLDPARWPPNKSVEKHPIVRGLFEDGFRATEPPLPGDEGFIDGKIDIASVGHVVDADSSQALAIDDVQGGRNLVIQGPPGTGKSQTITNLIGCAVRRGQRVLFVAEKMAALNVVRANLQRIGLGQVCLELHSHKANKRTVHEDLQATYQLAATGRIDTTSVADRLRDARDALNAYARDIHTPLSPSGWTPFEVFGQLAHLSGVDVAPAALRLPDATTWTKVEWEERTRQIVRLAAHVQGMGTPDDHPWRGARLRAALPQDVVRFARRAQALVDTLDTLTPLGKAFTALYDGHFDSLDDAQPLARLGATLAAAPTFDQEAMSRIVWDARRDELRALIDSGSLYAESKRRLDGILVPEAWTANIDPLRQQFVLCGNSWFRWFRPDYRAATQQYRQLHRGHPAKRANARIATLNALAASQDAHAKVIALTELGVEGFGTMWKGDHSTWSNLDTIFAWERDASAADLPPRWKQCLNRFGDLRPFASEVAAFERKLQLWVTSATDYFTELSFDLAEAFGHTDLSTIPLEDIRERLARQARQPSGLPSWCTWSLWHEEARQVGLGSVVELLSAGALPPEEATKAVRGAYFEALARQVLAEHPALATFDAPQHEHTRDSFRNLDRELIRLTRREIAARHVAGMPKGGKELGEIGTLAHEWHKQRRHLPLRKLVTNAGRAIQSIKPVWMMSPMSLAQFVAPGVVDFDLVIMDEASQVRPVEAIGAIARANQVVVAGDEKQLPPTSFFDRLFGEDDDSDETDDFLVADVESILGLCSAQGMPDRMLRWHYRSQHESLIAVSNLEFYKRLYVVPSAESDSLGLSLRKVPGVYDRGRTRTNRIEAREVAKAVLAHAKAFGRSGTFPNGMSLGVGTFSVAQRDAILDELELLRRDAPEHEPFFDVNAVEPFFVKNLESIQGDERDVIFISVGFGRDADGIMSMAFGPLTSQGGERRLNVLISRARRRCEVFSSITASDIDLSRTQSFGVRVLKTFLQYAESGHLDQATPGDRPIDSDFEEDVGTAIAALGYDVQHQVGVAGFFIDMAIRDSAKPGRYVLGIECDGATYHSSRSARDRDRLREDVLVRRGWRIHRIWSTAWFKRRDDEMRRVIAAIESARAADAVAPTSALSAGAKPERLPEQVTVEDSPDETPPTVPTPRYIEAAFSEHVPGELHQLHFMTQADIVVRIVAIEGPIHHEEVGRRFAVVCGKGKAGKLIQEAARDALRRGVRDGLLIANGDFYATVPVTACPPRDRSQTRSLTVRRADMLPPVEIRSGLLQVITDHIGVEPTIAIVAVARLFGFQRTGEGIQEVIELELRQMLGDGKLLIKNGNRLYAP